MYGALRHIESAIMAFEMQCRHGAILPSVVCLSVGARVLLFTSTKSSPSMRCDTNGTLVLSAMTIELRALGRLTERGLIISVDLFATSPARLLKVVVPVWRSRSACSAVQAIRHRALY